MRVVENPWERHMLEGRFEKAWEASDEYVRSGVHQPVWNGRPFEGQRVLIRCVHGLGDTIQFIRYARLLKEAGAIYVSAQMHPPLVPLLSSVPCLDRAFGWEGSAEYDVDIEVMELPWAFRTTVDTVPAKVPYLLAPKQAKETRCSGRIGLVWSSSTWDLSRSIPLVMLEPLRAARPVSLQHGPDHCQAIGIDWIEYTGEQTSDLLTTASEVAQLDLLITVDTMLAHLAGALGVSVWVLLKHDADWRWMLDRDNSPWYPTMRLFRQPEPGNWAAAIDQVVRRLKDYG